MNTRTDRLNRAVLIVIGALLVAAGALGLMRGFGVFGHRFGTETLISPHERRYVAHTAGWFWLAVAVVSLLLAYLCLRWLIVQLRSERVTGFDLEPPSGEGATRLLSGAVTDALSTDITGFTGVSRAIARVLRQPAPARDELVLVTVNVEEGADLGAVRRHVEEHAVPRLRQAVGRPLPVRVRLRVPATAHQDPR